MGDSPAEGGLGRALRIDMDELVIVGGVSEKVDPRLGHIHPVGDADLHADQIGNFCD